MSYEGKRVTGAPYSAQAVTESLQTLGDGNRIVRSRRQPCIATSEGRTRREQTFKAIGPWLQTASRGRPSLSAIPWRALITRLMCGIKQGARCRRCVLVSQ